MNERIFGETAFFDVALSIEVIEHLPVAAKEEDLKKINGILKPNGVVILAMPNKDVAFRLPQNDPQPYKNWLDRDGLKTMAKKHLNILFLGSVYFFPLWPVKHKLLQLPHSVFYKHGGICLIDGLCRNSNRGISLAMVGKR